jgi:hypothetical protein
MSERGISRTEIKEAIGSGTKTDAPGGIRMAAYKTKTKTLIVKYQVINAKEILVVTTFNKE